MVRHWIILKKDKKQLALKTEERTLTLLKPKR
jgi:hypothetical protein